MSYYFDDFMVSRSLDFIRSLSSPTSVSVCSQKPETLAQAQTTYMLCLKSGLTSGDYTITYVGNQVRLTLPTQTGIVAANSGTGRFVAIFSSNALLVVMPCNNVAISAGDLVTIQPIVITLTKQS